MPATVTVPLIVGLVDAGEIVARFVTPAERIVAVSVSLPEDVKTSLNEPFSGVPEDATFTVSVATEVKPFVSVTVTVTVYVPGVVKRWPVVLPLPVEPSPKFQV